MYKVLITFFSDSKKVLFLSFCIGLILSVISIFCSNSMYPDSAIYCSAANSFGIGDYYHGIPLDVPPLIPILSGLLCKIGIPSYYSMAIISSFFTIMTIFPLYGLLSLMMDKKYAAWGTLFFILAPKVERYGLAALLEGGRYFFLTLSLFLLFSFLKNKKKIQLLLLGITLALLNLTRNEGIIYSVTIIFALALLVLKENRWKINTRFLKSAFTYCFITLVTMLIFISPRLYQIYTQTGHIPIEPRIIKYANMFKKEFFPQQKNESIFTVKSKNETTNSSKHNYFTNKQVSSDTKTSIYFSSSKWNRKLSYFLDFLTDFSRGTNEGYGIVGILGMLILWKRKEWKFEHILLILFIIINAATFYLAHLAYRYFIVNIIFLMPFTLVGYRYLFEFSEKIKLQKLFLIAVLCVAIGQAINGMKKSADSSKLYFKDFGYWLREHKTELKRENNAHSLIILAFGKDPTYSFWANASYVDYFGIVRTGLIRYIKPFQSKYLTGAAEKILPEEEIAPDIIVMTIKDFPPYFVNLCKTHKNLKEIPTPWPEKFIVLKVLTIDKNPITLY